jgi:H+/Cl- antiporter ClcA
MPRKLAAVLLEESTLLASLAKWTTLGALVGILGGAATAVFVRLLDAAIAMAGRVGGPAVTLPLGLVAAVLLVRWLAPQAAGYGTDRVIEAVHRRQGYIPLPVAPVKLAATVLTIAAGGSVGKHGPAAQIGATLASALASLLALRPADRRKVVICGISAGFAAVFGTPIAGCIFGLEVLVLGSVLYDVLYPSFVAAVVAQHVAAGLGLSYFHETLVNLPKDTQGLFVKTLLAGVVFGLLALALVEALRGASALAARIPGPRWLLAAITGFILAGLAWGVSDRYLGLGLTTVEAAVRGAWVPPAAFALKIAFTALSFAGGGSGGIITPTLFIGATAGSTLGALLGFDRGTGAALGMVALVAGAANTPLAASVMAIELFGPTVGPLAALACIVSFLMAGHRSVFATQLLGTAKSGSLVARSGTEIGHATVVRTRRPWLRRLRALALAWRRRSRRR